MPAGTLPRLHLITDDAVLQAPRLRERTRELLEIGGPRVALHVRGHRVRSRDLWRYAEYSRALAHETGSVLLVNDRLDIALGCWADGVQLGQSSFPVGDARSLVGADRWIGVSVHGVREARNAVREGADFLVAGTLYETPSHPGRPGAGLEALADVVQSAGLPVIGIGGIGPERVGDVRRAEGYGVAVIRGVWFAASPAVAIRRYLSELE